MFDKKADLIIISIIALCITAVIIDKRCKIFDMNVKAFELCKSFHLDNEEHFNKCYELEKSLLNKNITGI